MGNRASRFFCPEGRTYSPPAKQAVVSLPPVGPCALRGGSRSLRRAPDNAAELAVSVVIACAAGRRLSPHLHRRCKSLSLPWDNLPPTCDKPATAQGTPFGCGSFVAEMDDAIPHRPFSFACAKRNKNASLRGRKDVTTYGHLPF